VPSDESQPPVPPSVRKELTEKQQREARRAEKVQALKRQQAREKRNRVIGWTLAAIAVVVALALLIWFVVGSSTPAQDPDDIEIQGLQTFDGLTQNHVTGTVDYAQSPPVGGDHAAVWLNCGIYSEPVPNENAVHDLEHGAVWVTYNPDEVTGDALTTLQDSVPDTYITMSPWPDLQAPVVASAWGYQVELDGVDDPRLGQFIEKFRQSDDAPEPGAPCTGGVDGPGLVS
jgi:hypothetical protein